MKPIFRLLRNVPVLGVAICFSFLHALPLFAQVPLAAAGANGQPALTPAQIEAVKQAVKSGAPLPPGVKEALEARPELKEQLPPEVKEKLEGKEKETEAAKKPAAPQSGEQAVLAPYDWKGSVYVAGLFSKRLHENEVGTLSHFGHEIFAPRQGGASILENMPVSPGYLIGPGDEVVVKLWGRMEGTYRMVVDRDGKIFFPKIGSLYVAGKTFEELKSFLRGKVGTIAEVS